MKKVYDFAEMKSRRNPYAIRLAGDLPGDWHRLSPESAEKFEAAPQREVSEDHVLRSLKCEALARRDGNDDVLFAVEGGDAPIYVVHLNWASEQSPNWPRATPFDSPEAFMREWDNS